MASKSYKKYENDKYELLQCGSHIIVKDKIKQRYFEASDSTMFADTPWRVYSPKIGLLRYRIYIFILVGFIALNFALTLIYRASTQMEFVTFMGLSLLYTLLHVIVHESAHVGMLAYFGKRIDRIGFKMNLIFPSIYVRMNDAYLLSHQEKIMVHSAGIFANTAINSAVLIFSVISGNLILLTIAKLFSAGILMNTVPVLNSDGYKILLASFMYNEKKNKIHDALWVKFIGYGNLLIAGYYFLAMILSIHWDF